MFVFSHVFPNVSCVVSQISAVLPVCSGLAMALLLQCYNNKTLVKWIGPGVKRDVMEACRFSGGRAGQSELPAFGELAGEVQVAVAG